MSIVTPSWPEYEQIFFVWLEHFEKSIAKTNGGHVRLPTDKCSALGIISYLSSPSHVCVQFIPQRRRAKFNRYTLAYSHWSRTGTTTVFCSSSLRTSIVVDSLPTMLILSLQCALDSDGMGGLADRNNQELLSALFRIEVRVCSKSSAV